MFYRHNCPFRRFLSNGTFIDRTAAGKRHCALKETGAEELLAAGFSVGRLASGPATWQG